MAFSQTKGSTRSAHSFSTASDAWSSETKPDSIFLIRAAMNAAQSASWTAGFVSERTKWIVSMT